MIDSSVQIFTKIAAWFGALNIHLNAVATHSFSVEPARDWIYSAALFGVTQQFAIDMKMVISAVAIAALSAFGAAALTSRDMSRDTAIELKQYAKAQEDFRIEAREFFRGTSVEQRSVSDRLTRQEILLQTHIASAIDSAFIRSQGGIAAPGEKQKNGNRNGSHK